jgi:hypothetical protein
MSYSLRVVIAGCLAAAPACIDASPAAQGAGDDVGNEAMLEQPMTVPTDVEGNSRPDEGGTSSCKKRVDGRYTCVNRVNSTIVNRSDQRVDMLRSNPSWFVCRTEANFSGGGLHPFRWAYTQGDDVGNWGWVRDIDIRSETDPMPPCTGARIKPIATPPPGVQ